MLLNEYISVVMAKAPIPGQVKTRLIGVELTPDHASAIAAAMTRCIVLRLARRGRVWLAISPDDAAHLFTKEVRAAADRVIDQGAGNLSRRIERVWSLLEEDQPVAFFGIDSPDVPDAALDELADSLVDHDLAIGPTPDGGYWTLAARSRHPAVVRDIDWGSQIVYDQTVARARTAGLSIASLAEWPDVDEPHDVEALMQRLRDGGHPMNGPRQRLLLSLETLLRGTPLGL